jgi:hypothetical protein
MAVAELTSPLLDAAMHEDGRVGVSFGVLGEKQLTLDEFQLASVADYLASQPALRAALQAELDRHHEAWDKERRIARGADVWRDVKVTHVSFDHRRVETRETIRRRLELFDDAVSDEEVEASYAQSDKPETRSRFVICLDADWHDGHTRRVDVRDGTVLEFIVE